MQQWLDNLAEAPEWLKFWILAASTLVSEDLTTISAGVLASQGSVHIITALTGCFFGIFIGDGLLYLVGLIVGKPALKSPLLKRFLTEERVQRCSDWLEKNGLMVVLISRFVPGTRLPTYFAAGLLGARARFFLPAAALAVAIWTPLLIGGAWFFGDRFGEIIDLSHPFAWLGLVALILGLFFGLRFIMQLTDWKKRRMIRSRLYRIRRWEFWPIAILYFPVFIFNLLLMLRYRKIFLPLVSNPGIEFSGLFGESKIDILNAFQGDNEFFPRLINIDGEKDAVTETQKVLNWMSQESIKFPIFLKPDVGQRGLGVSRILDESMLREQIKQTRVKMHVQEFVPGPYEFGVFYQRFPNEKRGRVLGLTGKDFPRVVGDGRSTLEELILRLPSGLGRYHIFLERFQDKLNEILPEGQTLTLVHVGNHCQGTIFKDDSHLITDAIQDRFEQISQSLPGFYIGRYDVKAWDLEAFRQGKEFRIMELNGAGGEPAHMYDSRYSLWFAYRTLFKQYFDMWSIGMQNHQKGAKIMSIRTFVNAWRNYRRNAYRPA